jgi:GxxExxY protein
VLTTKYRADFLCFSEVIVETKGIRTLADADDAQLINYLKVTGKSVGLLLNFGGASLEYRRLVHNHRD